MFITHNIAEAISLADRIVVLSPRSGRLSRIFPIDLPRPRTLAMTTTSRFIEMLVDVPGVSASSAAQAANPSPITQWAQPVTSASASESARSLASTLRFCTGWMSQAMASAKARMLARCSALPGNSGGPG